MKNFASMEIWTNGVKFRILVGMKNPGNIDQEHQTYLSKSGMWIGCESYGYRPMGECLEFDSKEDAVHHIQKEYGDSGIRLLHSCWHPC